MQNYWLGNEMVSLGDHNFFTFVCFKSLGITLGFLTIKINTTLTMTMTKTCQNDNGICIFLKPCHIEGDDHDYFHGHDHNKYNDNEHYHDLNYN